LIGQLVLYTYTTMPYSQNTTLEKVKVTHTLEKKTRDAVKALVEKGEVKDASAFIEEAVQKALQEQKLKQLALELEAFDNPDLVTLTIKDSEDGMADMATGLEPYHE
jgi:Arc/MetJ-type ribon-helix-helix transcriptional regulator